MIDTDVRLTENYERLIGRFFSEVYNKDINGADWVRDNIEGINVVLREILDIQISELGNPVEGQGSLYFDKGTSRKFPYENLSAGEKEVVDLVLDLYVKQTIYTNSIICIDEPELHLNTAIQRRLLIELEKLVPEDSQLWVATHSIGFLRALQEELRDKTTVLDFSNVDFDLAHTVVPIAGSRADWSRIFATALDEARYDAAVNDVQMQDLKLVQQEIQAACTFRGTTPAFKRALATAFNPGLAVYQELEGSIFP